MCQAAAASTLLRRGASLTMMEPSLDSLSDFFPFFPLPMVSTRKTRTTREAASGTEKG